MEGGAEDGECHFSPLSLSFFFLYFSFNVFISLTKISSVLNLDGGGEKKLKEEERRRMRERANELQPSSFRAVSEGDSLSHMF